MYQLSTQVHQLTLTHLWHLVKAAEMAMEDDYGMIDGVINNGKKEEPAERASVLDQLKEKQEAVPPAPPRRCCEEKEL